MKIVYDGANAYIKKYKSEELRVVKNALTYSDQDAILANKFSQSNYLRPESVTCVSRKTKDPSFPTGLLGRAISALDTNDFNYELECLIEDIETKSVDYPDWVYDHQKKLVETGLSEIRSIGQSPTGSGKTISICLFASAFPKDTVLIICPQNNILRNTKTSLETILGCEIGEYSGRKKDPKRVTIATINALYRNRESLKDWLSTIKVLVCDECHHISNGMYIKVSDYLKSRLYSWGVSATAYRAKGDSLWMEGMLGPVKEVIKESDLVEKNIIQNPSYCMFEVNHPTYEGSKDKVYLTSGKSGAGRFYYDTPNGKPHREEIYSQAVIESELRNNLILDCSDIYLNHPSRTGVGLILFQNYKHGEILAKKARERGLDFQYADGRTKEKEREEIVRGLRDRSIPLLIASKILNEGEDIRPLEFCVIAGGGSSARVVTQQIGRVIRNNAKAIVLDFMDKEEWYLERNSHSRKNQTEKLYPKSLTEVSSIEKFKEFIDEKLKV